MSYTGILIIIPGVCYGIAAALYASKGQWPLVVTYTGYLVGNIGLWWVDLVFNKS